MKIKSINIDNFRGIRNLNISFDESMTLIFGTNGVGKSTILDAAAILLSWVTARVRSPRGSGRSISEFHINNHSGAATISLSLVDGSEWDIHKVRKGKISLKKTNMNDVKVISDKIRERINFDEYNCSIPLLAYYPINRAVINVPLRIHGMHKAELLEAWDESLTSAASFRDFFAWFRQQEDLENESYIALKQGSKSPEYEFPNKSLQAVRSALNEFLPEFSGIRVKRNPLRMVVTKSGEELRVEQLSDGEKCMIALVGDVARRLAIANPSSSNPLKGDAIILIDEFDLHLHPMWQRSMINKLPKIFPNSQFILTTHSPQAIGEVMPSQIRGLYRDTDGCIGVSEPAQSYGLTSDQVLDEIMSVEGSILSRNNSVSMGVENIFDLIDKGFFEDAKLEISRLESILNGDIPDVLRAKTRLSMLDGGDDYDEGCL